MNTSFQSKYSPYGNHAIDVRELLSLFISRWYYFFIGMLISCGLGWVYIQNAQKIYRVKAKVSLEPIQKGFSEEEKSAFYRTEIATLTAQDLIEKSVDRTDLGVIYFKEAFGWKIRNYRHSPAYFVFDTSHVQLLNCPIEITEVGTGIMRISAFGKNVSLFDIPSQKITGVEEIVSIDTIIKVTDDFIHPLLAFHLRPNPNNQKESGWRYFVDLISLEELSAELQENMMIHQSEDAPHLLELFSKGTSTERQKWFLNNLLSIYQWKVNHHGESKPSTYPNFTTASSSNNISDVYSSQSEQPFSSSKRNSLLDKRKNIILEIIPNYENLHAILKNDGEEPPKNVFEEPGKEDIVVNKLLFIRETLKEEEIDVKYKTGGTGPLWEVVQLKIERNKKQILDHIERKIDAYQSELQGIESKREQIVAEGNSLDPEWEEPNEASTDFDDENLVIESQEPAAQIKIIESVRKDGKTPIAPQKSLVFLVCALIGVGFPILLIGTMNLMQNKVSSEKSIQENTRIPILGLIAHHSQAKEYLVQPESRSILAESFRSLRIKMKYLNEDIVHEVIGITSSSSGEGKTFCATNLAMVMAQAEKKTLLIDCDLRRPRLTRYFPNPTTMGLADYLAGRVSDWKKLVHPTPQKGFSVIHSGPVQTNPMDLLSTHAMFDFISEARKIYDHIIIDTPPLGLVSDYLIIMKLTDYNLYVVRDKKTKIEDLKWINELYDAEKIKDVGLVVNDVTSVAPYGYIDEKYVY